MGWGSRFPLFRQLNSLLPPGGGPNQDQRLRTRAFFDQQWPDGGYELGGICRYWEPGITPPPPWESASLGDSPDPMPYDADEAQQWFDHCAEINEPALSDLVQWIEDAIQHNDAEGHADPIAITYRYQRNKAEKSWTAECNKNNPNNWIITVTGPGF
jgi:hypothetical protein